MSWRGSQNSDLVVNNLTVNGKATFAQNVEIPDDIEVDTIELNGYIQNRQYDASGNLIDSAIIDFRNAGEIRYNASNHIIIGDTTFNDNIVLGSSSANTIAFNGKASNNLDMNNHQLLNISGLSGVGGGVIIDSNNFLKIDGGVNDLSDMKVQGSYLNWDSQSGSGTFDLICNKGGGPGGFRFYNQNTSGTVNASGYYAQLTGNGELQLLNADDATNNKSGSIQSKGGMGIEGGIFCGSDTTGNYTTSITKAGILTLKNTTPSTSSTTGALIVDGGLGVKEAINTDGIIKTANTTASTSSATGALVVNGGIGVKGVVYTDGGIVVNSNINATNTTNGALQVKGGISAIEDVQIGGNLVVHGTITGVGYSSAPQEFHFAALTGNDANPSGTITLKGNQNTTNYAVFSAIYDNLPAGSSGTYNNAAVSSALNQIVIYDITKTSFSWILNKATGNNVNINIVFNVIYSGDFDYPKAA